MSEFKHKKSLGQNFLNNEKIINDIASAIDTTENDIIIEVGPGQGALTKYLVNKPGRLICYEIDERVEKYLDKYKSDKCNIIFKDFLSCNFEDDIKDYSYDNVYFMANLPYYITTPIVEKIISSDILVDKMVLMVQKEVAERFAAKPRSKAYGSLTVYLNYYYDVEYLFDVNRIYFDPAPNVDSAVVRFVKKDKAYSVKNEELFFKLVKDSFAMKRKNLRNNLKSYDLAIIERILGLYNLSLQNRAEEIPIDVFVEIANNLF